MVRKRFLIENYGICVHLFSEFDLIFVIENCTASELETFDNLSL